MIRKNKSLTIAAASVTTVLGLALLPSESLAQRGGHSNHDGHDHGARTTTPNYDDSRFNQRQVPTPNRNRGFSFGDFFGRPQVPQGGTCGTPPPTCEPPIVIQLRQKVREIDSLASQAAWRYRFEVMRLRDCECSMNLYRALLKQDQLASELVRASRGSCKTTFMNAACAVHENHENIERLQVKAQVSRGVAALLREACPTTNFVHNNARLWQPANLGHGRTIPTSRYSRGDWGGRGNSFLRINFRGH